jgi:hypothetical protein
MSTPTEPPVPGAKLAEEARLLLEALAERAEPWLNRYADSAAAAPEPGAEHSPATCGWCPVCAGIAVLRGERPELAVRAAEHAAGLLAVVRSALAPPVPAPADPADPAAPAEPRPEPEAAPRVQKINVRRKGAAKTDADADAADDPTC